MNSIVDNVVQSVAAVLDRRLKGRAAPRYRVSGRWAWIVLLALVAVPVPALAQGAGGTSGAQVGCFRGRPLPACRSFWLIEMQGSTPLVQTTRRVTSDNGPGYVRDAVESALEWNLGHMVNVSERYAIGGALIVGTGNGDPLTGIVARGRRWLTTDVSVEVETGVARRNAGDSNVGGISGLTTAARLNIRDQGSFFVRWDALSLPEQNYPYNNYHDPGGIHHGLSVGASAGSVPGLFATGGLGLVYAVLLGIFLLDDS